MDKIRVAIITMTRDRIEYTEKCFQSLREKAGCDYDHYVLDNGSKDGTQDWLLASSRAFKRVLLSSENLGLLHGFNVLLSVLDGIYDVVIKFDNDCLIHTNKVVKIIVEEMARMDWTAIISPRVLGLNKPPVPIRKIQQNGYVFSELNHFGGIFYPIPWRLAKPISGQTFLARGLDWKLSERMRSNGLKLYYLEDIKVEHCDGTNNQALKYPEYFSRKYEEEKIAVEI